ncbi:helix-turn-helix domain-containing protein [Leptospira noguchii]|uniref:helix-turn-helix domain-containing protein n=1 Tax=Leptospira noguchii TaxID=28182 RepID=UPI0002BE613D|nr:helix-turn-helix domain-containing protein [Leptospira noguchii]EMI72184.1 DNA-binding helix-turn-helix protein [Leptospira noguchii str. Bonito]UOG37418.1 helix-turn-helix domain-containing protein [Leptospira noguchii]
MRASKKKESGKNVGFPERFRNLRLQKNLSQEDLGKIVGIHANHLGRYERGLSKPSAETLQKLAEALGVSSDFLISGTSEDFAKAKFEDKDLLRMFQEIEKFPAEEKETIKKVLDAFLTKRKVQELSRA